MLIFAPGFSTAKQVTEISGRGVGMDVVKRNIEAMRGRVSNQHHAGPGHHLQDAAAADPGHHRRDAGGLRPGSLHHPDPVNCRVDPARPRTCWSPSRASSEMINVRGEILPLVRLDRLFGAAMPRAIPPRPWW